MSTKPTGRNAVARFAFGVAFIFLIFSVVTMQYRLKDLKDRKEDLEIAVMDIEDNIQEIKTKLDTPLTPEYIARVAKEKLGYRYPNEIIFYNDYR